MSRAGVKQAYNSNFMALKNVGVTLLSTKYILNLTLQFTVETDKSVFKKLSPIKLLII